MELRLDRDTVSRYLSWTRAGLASICLLFQFIVAPVDSVLVTLSVGFYAAASWVIVSRKRTVRRNFDLLTLFIDTVFFMVLAKYGAAQTMWVAPAFYLYLLGAAVSLYGPREVLLVAGVCVLFFFTSKPNPSHVIGETIVVGGTLAAIFSVQKRRLEGRIDYLHQESERFQQTVDEARENERQRIAADFHDGPLQSFISFQMRLEIFRKILERNREAGLQELAQLQELSKSQVREMRSYVRDMRPLDVDGASLTAATRRLVEEFQKESGISVTFVGGERPFAAAPETSTDVLQMIREALNNVRKHSKATRVAVALEKTGKILEISIDDNGVGFHFSGTYNLDELDLLRLGPVSLKRRARSLGSELLLESRPGRGAGLKLRVPI
ncbi:MAG: sensor histidine kinase [Bryobacteraceae bacterium]